jgi:hypothetical protein
MPGVFAIPRGITVRAVVEDLVEISECSLPGEWEGQVIFLPL